MPRRSRSLSLLLCWSLIVRSASAAEPVDSFASVLRGNPQIVLSIDFGRHWRGPERESLRKISSLHPIVPSWELQNLPQQVGISAEAIDRVTIIAQPAVPGDETRKRIAFAGVVEAVEAKQIDALVEKYVGAELTSQDVHGRKLLRNAAGGREAHRVDSRTVVLGEAGAVAAWLASLDSELDPAWSAFPPIARKSLLTLQIGVPSFLGGLFPGIAASPFAPLIPAQRWRVTIEPEAGALRIALRGEFADADGAAQAIEPLKQVAAGLEQYLLASAKQMPEVFARKPDQYPRGGELTAPFTAAAEAAHQAAAKAEPKVEGNAAELILNIETAQPVTTAFLLITLLPRAEK